MNGEKSQAALEFIMTYGWTIAVALVAVGTLAYFGILSPDNFVPRRCVLEAGIGCTDFEVNEGTVTIVMRNSRGEDISITSIKIKNCTGTASGALKNGEQLTFIVDGCNNAPNAKFIGEINLTYVGETGISHKNIGNIVGKVEPGGAILSGSFYWITTTQQEFDEGSYSQTESIGAGSVQLDSAQNLGTYTSKIFDAGKGVKWNNISWGEPLPYKEHITPDGTSCADSSIRALWYLDEISGTTIDSSYCGKNGNNAGAAQGAAGKIKTAYDFDGLNDYIDIGTSLFQPFTKQITAMAWAKTMETNSPQGGEGHLIFYHGWDGEFNFGQGDADDFFYCYDYIIPPDNSAHWWDCVVSTIKAVKGSWYHIAVIWDSVNDKAQIFINGTLAGEKPLQPNWELHDSMTYHPTTLGAYTVWSGARTTLWNGSIDEVIVYNRTLSPSEILDNYKRGILNLSVEIRSCDDPNCDGESFSGSFTNASTQILNVPDNRYFQYRVNFDSEDSAYTSVLNDVTIGYTLS